VTESCMRELTYNLLVSNGISRRGAHF
jgi:hypothetical protein